MTSIGRCIAVAQSKLKKINIKKLSSFTKHTNLLQHCSNGMRYTNIRTHYVSPITSPISVITIIIKNCYRITRQTLTKLTSLTPLFIPTALRIFIYWVVKLTRIIRYIYNEVLFFGHQKWSDPIFVRQNWRCDWIFSRVTFTRAILLCKLT